MKSHRKLIKGLTFTVCILLVLTIGTGVVVYSRAQHLANNPLDVLNSGATPAPTDSSGQTIVNTTDPYLYNENIINVVLLGLDSDSDREALDMGYRSDTMLICAIDTQNNTVKAITIPRDTKGKVNVLDSKGNIVRTATTKINGAFNNAQAGRSAIAYQNTLAAIEGVLSDANVDLDLQYYAGIDMDGIAPITNAVGGVPVTLTDTIAGVGKKGETVLLKGDVAKKYIRTRKGDGLSGSDVDRANRQQLYFKGLAKQIKQVGIGSIPSLYSSVSKYVDTNLNMDQILALATTLINVDLDNIEFHTIEGEYVHENSMDLYEVDENALKQLALETWFVENPNYEG